MNDLDFTVQLISLVKKFDTPEQAIEAIKALFPQRKARKSRKIVCKIIRTYAYFQKQTVTSASFSKPAQTCSKFVRRLCAIDTTAHKKLQEFIKRSFHQKTIYSEKLNNAISTENIISQLITRRSLVQIQPPQPYW